MTTQKGPGGGIVPSKSIVGGKVSNLQGEELGRIEEVMIDPREGKILFAILSFGGLMGMGDKLFPIPWELMKVDLESGQFFLQVTKERLKTAPGFRRDDWPEMEDREWSKTVHGFFDLQPYWQTEKHERRGGFPGRRREDFPSGEPH